MTPSEHLETVGEGAAVERLRELREEERAAWSACERPPGDSRRLYRIETLDLALTALTSLHKEEGAGLKARFAQRLASAIDADLAAAHEKGTTEATAALQVAVAALDAALDTPQSEGEASLSSPEEKNSTTTNSAPVGRETIPDDFWRRVPCGHPPDPVAMYAEGKPVCHCGRILDQQHGIEVDEAPGPVVQCSNCGCGVVIPPKPSTQPVPTQTQNNRLEEIAACIDPDHADQFPDDAARASAAAFLLSIGPLAEGKEEAAKRANVAEQLRALALGEEVLAAAGTGAEIDVHGDKASFLKFAANLLTGEQS